MSTSTPDNQLDPQIAKLELTGVSTTFNSIHGFGIDLNVLSEAVGTTAQGDPQYAFRMAGVPSYNDLACEAQLSATDSSLFDWWKEISQGTLSPKDGTLTLSDASGSPQATFNIVGALLTSLTVSDHGLANPSAASITATLNCLSYSRQS